MSERARAMTCTRCGCEVELCAICEGDDCEVCLCYRCASLAVFDRAARPRTG
jgi:hypothetical protein